MNLEHNFLSFKSFVLSLTDGDEISGAKEFISHLEKAFTFCGLNQLTQAIDELKQASLTLNRNAFLLTEILRHLKQKTSATYQESSALSFYQEIISLNLDTEPLKFIARLRQEQKKGVLPLCND